jgi:hypothetical protein
MEKIEKVLCKKTWEGKKYSNSHSFEEGEYYDSSLNGSLYIYIFFKNSNEQYKGIFFPKNQGMSGFNVSHEKFEDHFYSPGETKNITRIKLIDRML